MNEKIILHSDLNAFYASVEMLLAPGLRGKAVAVCGSTEERHGIVLAKSEKAKKAGVKTGMANWEARQACPGLIVVPPQYDEYVKYSNLVRDIYRRYTNQVEPYGMDECWLDVTGCKTLFGSGVQIAEEIRETVKNETGLTVSVGVSFNKVFAKLASDMKKPDAVTVLDEDNWKQRVWPLPVSEMLFVGSATARKLAVRGIYTIGDLARMPVELVESWLKKNGVLLWGYANGLDRSRVMRTEHRAPVKSVGHGITCNCDLTTENDVWRVILELSQDIGHRLRMYGLAAKGVQVYVRRNDLQGDMHQMHLPYPTQSPYEIAQGARLLFNARYDWRTPVRAVSVRAINLVDKRIPVQLDVFGDHARRVKQERLDDCIDSIRQRFGPRSIISAALMGDLHMPEDGREKVRMPGTMYS